MVCAFHEDGGCIRNQNSAFIKAFARTVNFISEIALYM